MHGAAVAVAMPEIKQDRLGREARLFQGRQMLRRHLEITFSLLGRLLLATQEARFSLASYHVSYRWCLNSILLLH